MNIAVVGAGTRGTDIAQIMALGGHAVAIYDSNAQVLPRAQRIIGENLERDVTRAKIKREDADRAKRAIATTSILEQCYEADFMVVAIPEKLDLQKTLFEKMDRFAPQSTILAVTTETLPITAIAAAAKRFPQRIIGWNFLAPIAAQKVVEVIAADQTTQGAMDRSLSLLQQIGKETIQVKDAPGFLLSRVTTVYTGEALRLLAEGGTTAEVADDLMQTLGIEEGPFHMMDGIGLDTHLERTERLYEAYYQEARYRPHPMQSKMVQANRLGRKTKQGFFKYDE
jgi:3-hydroxybutyryl-CoA dehydrogenase